MPGLPPDSNGMQLGWLQTQAMLQHARTSAPEECCGALLGREGRSGVMMITRTVPIANRAADRRRAFAVAPGDVSRCVRLARQNGEDLLGFYHSHPAGPPYPSGRDIAEASAFDGMVHVIIGLAGRHEVKAWRTGRDDWSQIPLNDGG